MLTFDASEELNMEGMQLYHKKRILLHAIPTALLAASGTELLVHTLEGDVKVTSGGDYYIMIGWKREVYPIETSYFNTKYSFLAENAGEGAAECESIAREIFGGIEVSGPNPSAIPCEDLARAIRPVGLTKTPYVYAREILEDFRVLTRDGQETVFFGKAGSFLVCDRDGLKNLRIVDHDSMDATYEKG